MIGLRPPRALTVILAAFLLLGGAVSVLNPLFESTDEIRHYRYVRHLVVQRTLPVQGQELVRSQSHHPPLYYFLSALASAWVSSPHTPAYEHPTNPFWGYRDWAVGVDNKLQYLHGPQERFPFRGGFLAALIPRWVNVVLGTLTVWLTYRLGRRFWLKRPVLAVGAAALVAFNPQFIYLSAAMNNDIIAAAAGAATLLLCVELVQEGLDTKRLIRLGLVFGLALLSKLHLAALAGIIALAIWLAVRSTVGHLHLSPQVQVGQRSALAYWLRSAGIVLSAAVLLAGWWFVRNWQLYGDPTALNQVNELWGGRPASGNWWAIRQGLPYLWSSLWARFGYGQIPLPQLYYTALLALCLLALTGYVVRDSRFVSQRGLSSFVLLPATILVFTAIVLYYILIQPAGTMGRFLFPALPAFAVILVGGADRWIRRPIWTAGCVTLGMSGFAILALVGYGWPAVRYPAASLRPEPATSSVESARLEGAVASVAPMQVGDVAQIHTVSIAPHTLRPGEPLFITVVWEPLRRTAAPYIVYVHLVDEAGVLIAQRDTWPGLGRAPTTAWRPGAAFADTYRVDLPAATYSPNHAIVRVGLYEPSAGRLPVQDDAGESIGDGLTAGEIAIEPRPGPWPNSQQADFGGEVALVGYTLEPRALAAGETCTLTLYWQPHSVSRGYSVFAQVLGPEWNVWGSQDGAGPDWSSGGVLRDVRRITLLPDTPPGSYPIQVGLYHGNTGRLPIVAPDGHYLDERVLLGPLRVTNGE
jgi:hypothetical protein